MKNMKNTTIHRLAVLALIVLCKTNISAQYFPSSQDNPRWVMNVWSLMQFLDKEEIWTEPNTVILEGESWTPLTRVHHWNPNSPIAPPDPTPDTTLLGYYRMDGEKVYYRDNSQEGDIFLRTGLIYDFSLEAGDSIFALGTLEAFPDSVLYRVHETGTFECNGEVRKWLRVGFHQGPSGPSGLYHETYWVQGIGDVQHPFIPGNCLSWSSTCESIYMDQTLFLGNDSIRITGVNFPCVSLLQTSVVEGQNKNTPSLLKVFPNPVPLGSVVHIQAPNPESEASYMVELYSSSGQLLHKSTSDLRQPVKLPEGVKTSGLYHLVVRNEQGLLYGSASLLVVD